MSVHHKVVDAETGEVLSERFILPGAPDEAPSLASPSDLYLDEKGREIPDATPIAPPLGYKRQPSLAEQIRAMVVSENLRLAAEAADLESFEESEDFDVGDDFDPSSPYENEFDPPISELREALAAEQARRAPERSDSDAAGGAPEAPVTAGAPPAPKNARGRSAPSSAPANPVQMDIEDHKNQ